MSKPLKAVLTVLAIIVAAFIMFMSKTTTEQPIRSVVEEQKPRAPATWWAKYGGMEYIIDENDPNNTVPALKFLYKYPRAFRKVWEENGIRWDSLDNRFLCVNTVVSELDEMYSGLQVNWPSLQKRDLEKWWDANFLGDVKAHYSRYICPSTLDIDDLDKDVRNALKKKNFDPLTAKERRSAIFELCNGLTVSFNADAENDGKMFVKSRTAILVKWREKGLIK